MYFATVLKTSQVDDYEHGVNPGELEFIECPTIEATSLDVLLSKIKEQYGEPYIFDDRLEFSCQENADGLQPTERELAIWKNETELEPTHVRIYCVDYSFYISESRDIGMVELKKIFPQLKEQE